MSIRHEISDILLGYALTGKLTENLDRIMGLISDEISDEINKRYNQYQELVDAAIDQVETSGLSARPKLRKAVKPFIKLSLSEKLIKLSGVADGDLNSMYSITLKELAEQAKTLEQELELMKYR